MKLSVLRMVAIMVSATFLINGCSTTRIHVPPSEQTTEPTFEKGAAVEVVLRNGETVALTVVESQPGLLSGVDDSGSHREILWDDVAAVTTNEISAGKTAAAIGGGLLIVYILAAAATVSVLGAGF